MEIQIGDLILEDCLKENVENVEKELTFKFWGKLTFKDQVKKEKTISD